MPVLSTPVLVGVDPGQTTGLAGLCASTGAVVFVGSAGPLDTVRKLEAWATRELLAGAVVEDARGLPIYARHGGKNRGERDRVARSVGRVDGLTDLYAGLLRACGVEVTCAEPLRAQKWDADEAARVTGWTGRCNQHGRDALRILWHHARSKTPHQLA